MRQQVAISQDQSEAQIRAALTLTGKAATLQVVNVGSGPALNLRLVNGQNQTVFQAQARVDTNFGMRVKGDCIAPGEAHAKATNEKAAR